MLRINAFYLYRLAQSFDHLRNLQPNTKYRDAAGQLALAYDLLSAFLGEKSPYRFKTSISAGHHLLGLLETSRQSAIDQLGMSPMGDDELGWNATQIINSVAQYEPLLEAEMMVADTFLVLSKGAFDTTELVENGICIFPSDLAIKVPGALADCRATGRCIAFELFTSAGFHLHRLNEAVLREYFAAVTGNAKPPQNRTIQAYLNALDNHKAGDKKVKSALKDIKDLHRNPLIHPEDELESVEEVLALHGSIYSAVMHMLKKIPLAPP